MKFNVLQMLNRSSVKRSALNALFWFAILMYMETLLHILFFDGFGLTYLYTVGFTAVVSLLISGLLGFLPAKINAIVSMIITYNTGVLHENTTYFICFFAGIPALIYDFRN